MPSKVVMAEALYIDPADCDSLVAYKIIWEKYSDDAEVALRATMTLTDCSRKIDWYFDAKSESGGVAKIDKAIAALTAFKKKFVAELKKDSKSQ